MMRDSRAKRLNLTLITSKNQNVYKYKEIRFWAEDGSVICEDLRTTFTKRYSWQEFALFAKTWLDIASRKTYPSERDRLYNMVEDMGRCIRTAKIQAANIPPGVQSEGTQVAPAANQLGHNLKRHRPSGEFSQPNQDQFPEFAVDRNDAAAGRMPVGVPVRAKKGGPQRIVVP